MVAQLFLTREKNIDSSFCAARCLRTYAKQHGILLPEFCISRGEHGKPCLTGNSLFFSVSHTDDLWGCVVAPCPVGLDLQRARKVAFAAIARRYFSLKEQEFFAAHPEGFFPVWTAKEAYSKWDGRGISIGLPTFSVADAHGLLPQVQGVNLQHFTLSPQEFGCLASQLPVKLQIETIKNRL